MTFLSATLFATPDAFRDAVPAGVEARPAPPAANVLATLALTALVAVAVLTVPAAVVEAKWSKLGLVLGFAQHRLLASGGA